MQIWVRYLLAVAGCVCVSPPACAADNNPAPTLEFLEFLAEWESEDGVWLDPMLPESATPGSEHAGKPANDKEKK